MWYMGLRLKTKYVLGLPGGTQIGLEHGKKNPKEYEHQLAVKDSIVFFKASIINQ